MRKSTGLTGVMITLMQKMTGSRDTTEIKIPTRKLIIKTKKTTKKLIIKSGTKTIIGSIVLNRESTGEEEVEATKEGVTAAEAANEMIGNTDIMIINTDAD